MAPLILSARANPSFDVRVCVTGQHQEMLYQVLEFFGIRPDHDLKVMKPDQGLFGMTASILLALERVLDGERPDMVLVQGDTTTAFVGALASYYRQTPVSHIEAGLRSFQKYSPFPEEVNRLLVGHIADVHFAPTERSRANLRAEGISSAVHVVGNTVIDALFMARDIVREQEIDLAGRFPWLDDASRMILVTGHRRESFGEPFREICEALREIASRRKVRIVYPVHLNPNVRKPVMELLSGIGNVHLIEPVPYPELVWLMGRCHLVLTDSGGIQEEAPSLGKPVLVMRDVTERVEGIEAGTCRLVGTRGKDIVSHAFELLDDDAVYASMATSVNPYGDGRASGRILAVLQGIARS